MYRFEGKFVHVRNESWNDAIDEDRQGDARIVGIIFWKVQVVLRSCVSEKEGDVNVRQSSETPKVGFGQLKFQVPSEYYGGEIVVKFKGEVRTFKQDCEKGSMWQSFYVARYQDGVDYDVRPITKGCRLVLEYLMCVGGAEMGLRCRMPL